MSEEKQNEDGEGGEEGNGGGIRIRITGLEKQMEKAGYFSWTASRKLQLAKAVRNYKAYIKTDINFEVKFGLVKQKLKDEDDFKTMDIGWKALQTQFQRDSKEVLAQCGISDERVNLSGMEKCPTELQSLHISMAEEVQRKEINRKRVQTKEAEKDALLNGISTGHLNKQAKKLTNADTTPAFDGSIANDSKDSGETKKTAASSISNNSGSGSKPKVPTGAFTSEWIVDLTNDMKSFLSGGNSSSSEVSKEDEELKSLQKELLREQLEEVRLSKKLKLKQLEEFS